MIELIRQFYDTPRAFRIIGENGSPEYVEFNNAALQQQTVSLMGEEFKTKEPVFDIIIKAQKANPYSRLSQNELALQFYNLGFFNPELTDQALATIEMMDFDGKEKVSESIRKNGTMYERIQQLTQVATQLAQVVAVELNDPRPLQALQQTAGQDVPPAPVGGSSQLIEPNALGDMVTGNTQADKMRRRMQAAAEVK